MTPIAKLHIKNNKKYFQTLKGHTQDALKILKSYIENHNYVMDQFCKRWGLDKTRFIESLFVTIYLHDIGKLTGQFQNNINEGKHSSKYPHAFYAFCLLKDSSLPKIIEDPIELAAITGHHTQLYNGLYDGIGDFGTPKFLEDEIKDFINQMNDTHQELGFDSYFTLTPLEISEIPAYRVIPIARARKDFINQIQRYQNKEKLKSIFTYFFSILQTCDDYSSAEFADFIDDYEGSKREFDSVMRNTEKYIPSLQVENPIETVLKGNAPYSYQREIFENAKPNSVLFAPCGRGKTEAALLWALKIMGKYTRNKIIFAMPTQTTSNAMYDRLCIIFGKGKDEKEKLKDGKKYVGIFHGKSYIKLKQEKEKEKIELEEKDIDDIRGETFKGNIFFNPITVTTIDHLIYSFIHGFSQGDFALGNVQNSILIFDEVHYYEKKTLEHLTTLFKILNKKEIPHFLMSGTLPEFIKKEIRGYREFTDTEGLKFMPFYLNFEKENLVSEKSNPEVLEEIKQNYSKGLNQFIILNTIERAKTFYRDMVSFIGPDENIMLYHSQFTFNDRAKKENKIMRGVKNKPFILVATQVIEVSLDISCDVMYTELAPPDALGQRAGRLNRNGKSPEGEVRHELKIFLPQKELPYPKDLIDKSRENLGSFIKACTYLDIKNFCDQVYDDYTLKTSYELKTVFKKCSLFGYSPSEIAFGEDEGKLIQIRENTYQKIDVIPECIFKESGVESLLEENKAKVPLWWLKNEIEEFGDAINFYEQEDMKGNRFRICTFPYDYSTGFDFVKEGPDSNIC